jgi:hypothetical protein
MDENTPITVKIQTTIEKFDEAGNPLETVNLEEEQTLTLGQVKALGYALEEEDNAAG